MENAFYKFKQWIYFYFINKLLYITDIWIKNTRITLDAAVMKDFLVMIAHIAFLKSIMYMSILIIF